MTDTVLDPLLSTVLQILGSLLATALIALAVQALKKIGITLDVERQQQLEAAARQAVLRVEEAAAAAIKRKLPAWTSTDKLEHAVTDVITRVPRVDENEARAIVQAVLPGLGLGATALGKALRTPK